MAKVLSINISEKKGTPKTKINPGVLIEDFGFEGDAHAGKWHRQVSLLAKESIEKAKGMPTNGLCHGVFAENITTEGIVLHTLPVGTKLQVGECVLEISQIGKECHDGCAIRALVGQCIMPKEGVFAKVIKGGKVFEGDEIKEAFDIPPSDRKIYRKMKRVIIIGCPGSGKTTFAEKLNKSTGLPLYYLDAIWHKPDKTHISREEFDRRISEIFATDEWIIDGNYARTVEMRIKECDTVILFDLPTELCLQGATDRLGKGRYDLPWIEKELDPEFERVIRNFADSSLPGLYELIEKYRTEKQVIIFKSRKEADDFLKEV